MTNTANFVIQPLGGLANRMRVIAKCYEIAQATGTQMQVNWINDDDCGAEWEDLFADTYFHVVKNGAIREVVWQSPRWYHHIPVWKYKFYNGFDKMLTAPIVDKLLDEDEKHPEIFCHTVEKWLKKGKRIFLATGSFLGISSNMSMFNPIPELQIKIENFFNTCGCKLPAHLYGVHIRRTDNIWSIQSSPIELFIETIYNVIAKDPDACFYLATDDKKTIEILCSEFGNRIIVREKEFSRTSSHGIQDALIDMWLLSKTRRILGSFYSSFSEMASWIGGNQLTIIKK